MTDAMPAIYLERREPDTPGIGAYYWAVTGADVSFVTANIPAFIQQNIPGVDFSAGYIFCQPHRQLLMLRDITLGDDLFNGLGIMAPYSFRQYDSSPADQRVNPNLFLIHGGTRLQLTSAARGNEPTAALGFALNDQGPLGRLLAAR